jgi:uncharacterized protein YuzE
MNIHYNTKIDLLYLRLDEKPQDVMNKQISDDVVLDIGNNEQIVGIEILDASKRMNLEKLFPFRRSGKIGDETKHY